MYRKRKSKKKHLGFFYIGIIVFLIGISFFVVQKKRNLSLLEAIIKDSGLFIQKLILSPFKEDKEPDKKNIQEKAAASDALIAKNEALEQQLEELKQMLELNNILTDRSYLNATAINRNVDYWYQTITIDKGKHNGVEQNMPVIVSEGLIGFVSKTSNFNSTVQLLTVEQLSQKISVKIKVDKKYIYGLLTGYNKENNTFEVEGISENIDIPVGAQVTTTGLGEYLPAGIVVGYVKTITTDNFDLAKLVEIESKVNFDEIYYVTILKRESNET